MSKRFTAEELAKLREIAEAATPGPYELVRLAGYSGPYALKMKHPKYTHSIHGTHYGAEAIRRHEDAVYFAAMDRDTALALLDRIEVLEHRNGEVARLILDAISWLYDEEADSVAVDESNRRRGLEQLRQALLLLAPETAARFKPFWQW